MAQLVSRFVNTMKRALTFVILSLAALTLLPSSAAEVVLLEAERFDSLGGWKVDAQFVESMGSPYLIAHGLGVPVADAATSVAKQLSGYQDAAPRVLPGGSGKSLVLCHREIVGCIIIVCSTDFSLLCAFGSSTLKRGLQTKESLPTYSS